LLLLCTLAAAFVFAAAAEAQRARPVTAASIRSITIVTEPTATVWLRDVKYGITNGDGQLEVRTDARAAQPMRVRAAGFKDAVKTLSPTQKGELRIPLVKTTDEAELAFQQAEAFTTTDRDKAVEAYKKAIAARPNYIEARLGLARVLMDARRREEALAAIRDLRKIKPGIAEASAIEGRLYKENGEEDKAIAAFKKAITEGRGFQPEAYTGLGLLYQERAEGFGPADMDAETAAYTEAATNYAAAIKQLGFGSDAPVVMQLLGRIYEQQKRYKEAIALYEDFLRRFPTSDEADAVRSFIVQIKNQMDGDDNR
jgi:tetratricopeptide (TPR) repeat protein